MLTRKPGARCYPLPAEALKDLDILETQIRQQLKLSLRLEIVSHPDDRRIPTLSVSDAVITTVSAVASGRPPPSVKTLYSAAIYMLLPILDEYRLHAIFSQVDLGTYQTIRSRSDYGTLTILDKIRVTKNIYHRRLLRAPSKQDRKEPSYVYR